VAKIKAIRYLSKDLTKEHKDIYEALNLSRGSYYRYLDMVKKYTDEELNTMVI
jgi:ACT domain-containing protein